MVAMAGDGEYFHTLHPNASKNDSKGNQDNSQSPPSLLIELDQNPQVAKSSSGSEALAEVKEVLDHLFQRQFQLLVAHLAVSRRFHGEPLSFSSLLKRCVAGRQSGT